MKTMMMLAIALAAAAACNDAQIASTNLSRAADNFEILPDIDLRGSGRELLENSSDSPR